MANYVRWNMEFHQINDDAKKKLIELISRVRKDQDHMWFGDLFVDEKTLTYKETEQYSWTLANIGPKWCYFEEMDIDSMTYYGDSAWSAPEDGVTKLLEILEEHDPNLITSLTYQDEGPNFFGAYVYRGNECLDSFENDYDELIEMVCNEIEELEGKYINEEWEDQESEDIFNESMWECISNYQSEMVSDCIDTIEQVIADEEKETVDDVPSK